MTYYSALLFTFGRLVIIPAATLKRQDSSALHVPYYLSKYINLDNYQEMSKAIVIIISDYQAVLLINSRNYDLLTSN